MKKGFIFIVFLAFCSKTFSQEEKLKAYFKSEGDTLEIESTLDYEFEVVVPEQESVDGVRLEIFIEKNIISPEMSRIFLQEDRVILLDDEKEVSKKFLIKLPRDKKNDKLVILKLRAYNKSGGQLQLDSDLQIAHHIYIKPADEGKIESDKKGYQMWFHTGTNFDFLDGVKAEDLYFKGSYLFNIPSKKGKSEGWIYATFGKNRYSTSKDSIIGIHFNDVILNPSPSDSVQVVNGYYNTTRQVTTESIFASINYMKEIPDFSNEYSRFFVIAGIYWDLQLKINTYKNGNIVSDTLTIPNYNEISLQPLARERKFREMNTNVGIGISHILSNDKIDIKTQLMGGLNTLYYPRRITELGLYNKEEGSQELRLFTSFKVESTVLDPGISIGFETFIKTGHYPLFNVYLTKILSLRQITALFSPVSSL